MNDLCQVECVREWGGGDHYFREGSLLSGFTSSHKKLTLISGVASFGASLLSELYSK